MLGNAALEALSGGVCQGLDPRQLAMFVSSPLQLSLNVPDYVAGTAVDAGIVEIVVAATFAALVVVLCWALYSRCLGLLCGIAAFGFATGLLQAATLLVYNRITCNLANVTAFLMEPRLDSTVVVQWLYWVQSLVRTPTV